MKNLAIIPARGGSKRIPGKNIKNFLGRPIICYSIETALESNLFDEVMVSTEDEEIAELAKNEEASVPFLRSAENADDYATTVEVLLEVVENYREFGQSFDRICCIYPTAPFVTVDDLERGFELLDEATSALPVVEFEFPILRAFARDDNGTTRFEWPEHDTTRSQDMAHYYHDAGQWYWIDTELMVNEESLITSECKSIVKPRMEVQDIDTPEDWRLAEMKYKLLMYK